MRKGKVAAAFMCLLFAGMLGGIKYSGQELSVARADQSNQILEITDVAVTTTTSIETTTLVTTTATTTKKAKPVTTSAASTTKTTTTATTTSSSTTQRTTETTTASTTSQTTTETVTTTTETVTAAEAPLSTMCSTVTAAQTTVTEEEIPQTAAVPQINDSYAISVTDREYIMLCNVVGHEYGSDWVPIEEKALVAEVIMNRVNSPQFPDTIYEVLTQYNQFAGLESLVEMDHMSGYVTQSVRDAVDLYLSNPAQFQHGYLFFNGDGYRNYFRSYP